MRVSRKNRPGSLQVIAKNFCWMISLWWETPPWFSQVVARSAWYKDEGRKDRDEGGGDARASVSVRDFQIDMQSRGTDEQVVCGKRHRDAAVAKGRLPSAAKLDSTACGPRPRKVSWKALKDKGCLGLSGGVDWAKGPRSISPEEAGW